MDSLVEYGSRRVIITITAIFCALLEIVDTTIVNVALNDMRGTLGATLSEAGWIITAYAIGNVIIVPMTSWLSQQFGRRNYFAASIIIFTVFSFLCGNATGIWELVIFRFLQGIGGGYKKHLRQIVVKIKVVVIKAIVLLRIKHFQQGSRRVAAEICAHLVYFVQAKQWVIEFYSF